MENTDATKPSEAVKPDTGGEGTPRPEGTEATDAASVPNQSTDPAGSEGVRPAQPAKIKFTSKVRRGLALFRMVQMAALSDDMPPAQTMIERWTKAQQSDYNAALAWCEQEEDWDAVADAWERGKGRK